MLHRIIERFLGTNNTATNFARIQLIETATAQFAVINLGALAEFAGGDCCERNLKVKNDATDYDEGT